jgi:hypothetical protein
MSLYGEFDGIETTRQIQDSYNTVSLSFSSRCIRDETVIPSGFIMKPIVESGVLLVVEKAIRQ